MSECLGLCAGSFGHSQGVAASLVVSVSQTAEEFAEATVQMCVYLLHHGVRCYTAFLELQGSEIPEEGARARGVCGGRCGGASRKGCGATGGATWDANYPPPPRLPLGASGQRLVGVGGGGRA